MQTEGQKELEAAQNDNVVESEIDESGAVEAAEYAGITEDVEGENTPPESDQNDNVQEEVVAPKSKYIKEVEIKHLKNPVTLKVFEATPDLMKRKDLLPCDENGKNVYDHRRL